MNTARLVRSVGFLIALGAAAILGGKADAHPLRGTWVANAPCGVSTYHFGHGHRDKHDKHAEVGRFYHSYVDFYHGLVVLHGTWILHHDGPTGTLEMHFDSHIHVGDVAWADNGMLSLWNVGTGKGLMYGRLK